MRVILETKTAEFIEKKSRFISTIYYVPNIETCEKIILEHKKKYYDAKHNCYAYILGKDAKIEKSTDDGEPQGTAGHPMLDILKGEKLTYILAIVTRYFGGILLGTGGLVHSYSESLKMAIAIATFSNIEYGYVVRFLLKYDEYGAFVNILKNIDVDKFSNANIYNDDYGNVVETKNIIEIKKEFSNEISLEYIINENVFDLLNKKIVDLTKGRVIFEKIDLRMYYINLKKEIVFI